MFNSRPPVHTSCFWPMSAYRKIGWDALTSMMTLDKIYT